MPIEVTMPQMGESIFEGTITRWIKKAGDPIEKDEPLFKISTDKLEAEIPSPVSGIVRETRFPEGTTVRVNTVVVVIADAAEVGEAQPSFSAVPETPTPSPESRTPAPKGICVPAAPPGMQLPEELVPLTKMRAIIAQRMAVSVQTAPHVHTVFRVDMTRIVQQREREKAKFEQRNGLKLTYMPFVAVAAVLTLRKFPIVNASLEGNSIRYHRNINLGIAVALDWGLIVPVIKQAEELNFLALAGSIADLAERARGKRLKPDEVSGSTFTLTNSGIFGEEFATPIINQPDSAILAIGGLRKDSVVVTDVNGNDSIAICWIQHFCLGFDHRIIDGADAGRFMNEFKKTLENWNQAIE